MTWMDRENRLWGDEVPRQLRIEIAVGAWRRAAQLVEKRHQDSVLGAAYDDAIAHAVDHLQPYISFEELVTRYFAETLGQEVQPAVRRMQRAGHLWTDPLCEDAQARYGSLGPLSRRYVADTAYWQRMQQLVAQHVSQTSP